MSGELGLPGDLGLPGNQGLPGKMKLSGELRLTIPNQRAPFDPHIAGQQANTWRAATDLTNRLQCVPLTPSENNPDVHL